MGNGRSGEHAMYGVEHVSELPSERPLIVIYYATWCGYCKKLNGAMEQDPEILSGMQRHARVVAAESSERDLFEQEGVRGYPTIRRYGKNGYEDHRGERTADALAKFARGSDEEVLLSKEERNQERELAVCPMGDVIRCVILAIDKDLGPDGEETDVYAKVAAGNKGTGWDSRKHSRQELEEFLKQCVRDARRQLTIRIKIGCTGPEGKNSAKCKTYKYRMTMRKKRH